MKGNVIGDIFHIKTKYRRSKMRENFSLIKHPELYKIYPYSKKIKLPKPEELSKKLLDDVLKQRKSIRSFSSVPISKKQLSYLLWASTGIQRKESGYEFRTAPSAGALYPIETYLIVNNVEEIPDGIYHYSIEKHVLEELKPGNYGSDVAHAALDQTMCAEAAVVFVWTAIFDRSKWKYGTRAYRYIYLEAGHIAQNLALAATNLGLDSCQIAAFFDDEINSILDIDGIRESTIYMSTIGYTKIKN